MEKNSIGIDIAKLSFVAAIKINNKNKVQSFSNNEDGFKEFSEWLQQFFTDSYHFCIAYSVLIRPVIPFLFAHLFRLIPPTHSGAFRP